MKNKNRIKTIIKKTVTILSILVLCFAAFLWFVNWHVKNSSKGYIYDSIKNVPYKKIGLLLGTSKKLSNGQVNLFFKYRINATTQLYENQKIKYIIISGDHSEKYYNEPEDMKKELIANGIPDSVIFLDYAGLRTWDSILRCKQIFGEDDFMIISQLFHNERAIYIAKNYGIKAIAYNAEEPSNKFGIKTYIREYFARVKLLLDVLTEKKPNS